jgi:hypothetical protein
MLLSFLQQKNFPFRAGVLANSAKKTGILVKNSIFSPLWDKRCRRFSVSISGGDPLTENIR